MKKKSTLLITSGFLAVLLTAGFSAAVVNLRLLSGTQPSQTVGQLTPKSATQLLTVDPSGTRTTIDSYPASGANARSSDDHHDETRGETDSYRDWDD